MLDTHVLLWALREPARLHRTVRNRIQDRRNVVFISVASIWEIAIKSALRRNDFDFDPKDVLEEADRIGFTVLAISGKHAVRVRSLEHHHRDPFDRLIIAQALEENVRLMSADEIVCLYTPLVEHVVDQR